MRGGTILVEKDDTKKSALQARNGTGFVLTIYLNKEHVFHEEPKEDGPMKGGRIAKGWLYLDDGESYNFST